ncbi:MAG TPA: hypothetical protein PKD85_18840, partial [Saprospiraceae bacterium]|nr:hypothetical protein [Saprospiraceae bacterium]
MYILLFIGAYSQLPFLTALGIVYFFISAHNLMQSLGRKIPFIELTIFLTILQVIIAPILEYHLFFNEVFGVMKVSELQYLSFVIPSTMVFHLGLKSGVGKYEVLFSDPSLELFKTNRSKYIKRGQSLIVLGISFTLLAKLFSIPAIGFIVVLFSMLKFIGLFYLWMASSRNFTFYFLLVMIPFILDTLKSTIFIDLIVWSVFFYSFYLIKAKANVVKLTVFSLIAFFSLVIFQSVKYDYRHELWWGSHKNANTIQKITLLGNLISQRIATLNQEEIKLIGSVVNIRFNQGWIISDVMHNTDKLGNHANFKYLGPELLGVLLPRFLFPNKISTSDNRKFNEYTGWKLG